MGLLLDELRQRVPDGWFLRRLLPALLLVAVAAVGWRLGWAHWSDLARARQLIAAALPLGAEPAPAAAAGLVLVLLAAVAAALALPFAAGAVGALAAGAWPWWLTPPARRLTRWRERRWVPPEEFAREAVRARAAGRELRAARLDARRARADAVPPTGPTWSGDRLRATEDRIRATTGTDVAMGWTALLLTAPDAAREALSAARDGYDAACEALVWSAAFTLVGLRWWPAAAVGLLLALAAHRALRRAVITLCHTTEAVLTHQLPDRPGRPAAPSGRG
ncbi:hypothetical protein [Kitasatospora sp. NPDC093806]|uniref:hypothetical protein n=1 Tax=Kitasatospora sp. NPDC093806 TaxID=3155075 RepID=UPI003437D546